MLKSQRLALSVNRGKIADIIRMFRNKPVRNMTFKEYRNYKNKIESFRTHVLQRNQKMAGLFSNLYGKVVRNSPTYTAQALLRTSPEKA